MRAAVTARSIAAGHTTSSADAPGAVSLDGADTDAGRRAEAAHASLREAIARSREHASAHMLMAAEEALAVTSSPSSPTEMQ